MRLPRVRLTVRRMMVAVAFVAAAHTVYVRVYRQVVPVGAEFFPFWMASEPGPTLASPKGRWIVQVVFNDAGGAHSGNHWTWLIAADWLSGKRVIAAYSSSNVRNGKVHFPVQWVDEQTLAVRFTAKRYGDTLLNPVVVRLR